MELNIVIKKSSFPLIKELMKKKLSYQDYHNKKKNLCMKKLKISLEWLGKVLELSCNYYKGPGYTNTAFNKVPPLKPCILSAWDA